MSQGDGINLEKMPHLQVPASRILIRLASPDDPSCTLHCPCCGNLLTMEIRFREPSFPAGPFACHCASCGTQLLIHVEGYMGTHDSLPAINTQQGRTTTAYLNRTMQLEAPVFAPVPSGPPPAPQVTLPHVSAGYSWDLKPSRPPAASKRWPPRWLKRLLGIPADLC